MNSLEAQQFLVIVVIVHLWFILFGLIVLFTILRQFKQKPEMVYAPVGAPQATISSHLATAENPHIMPNFTHTQTAEIPALSIAGEKSGIRENAEASSVIKHRTSLKNPKSTLAS